MVQTNRVKIKIIKTNRYLKGLILLILFFIIFHFYYFSFGFSSDSKISKIDIFSKKYILVKVQKVIDGDTLRVFICKVKEKNNSKDINNIIRYYYGKIVCDKTKSYKVRIFGIDTPEKYYSKKLLKDVKKCDIEDIKEEITLGKLASKHAKEILDLKHNSYFLLKVIKKAGVYGRVIGKIYLPIFKNSTIFYIYDYFNTYDFGYKMINDGYSCYYKYSTEFDYRIGIKEPEINKKGLWKVNYNLMECLCY